MMSSDKTEMISAELNARIGSDLSDLEKVYDIQAELLSRKKKLVYALTSPESDIMIRLSASLKKAEDGRTTIKESKEKTKDCQQKIKNFLQKTEPLQSKLKDTLKKISNLENILEYLRSLEAIESLTSELKKSKDLEQNVLSFMELRDMCSIYKEGHRATHLRETTRYWHNNLKDRLSKEYDDIMKQLHWPFTSSNISLTSTPSPDTLSKFAHLTQLLLQIHLPDEYKLSIDTSSKESLSDMDVCLPIRLLLRPLKRRFAFHFTGNRKTARLDRPEWFLTQTLTWIRDHVGFVRNNVQPVADKLEMFHVNAELEFSKGLVGLAAERLHRTLAAVESESAAAHALDEALGFERELRASGRLSGLSSSANGPSVLAVLTQAPIFIRWLAVEKKYALLKMDEILNNPLWMEPVLSSEGSVTEMAAAGDSAILWVPRGADWFVCLLQTIEDRYSVLPQPGHRLQFLGLQRDLIEEWRVRLNQLLSAALSMNPTGCKGGLLDTADAQAGILGGPVAAVINSAHHTRSVLLEWTHSVHYLQLFYYEEQFQHFTELQHKQETDITEEVMQRKDSETNPSLVNMEAAALVKAEKKAVSSEHSKLSSPVENSLPGLEMPEDNCEDAGVFGEAPALLMRLCDAGIAVLCETILMDFKAATRDYRNEKWYSMGMRKGGEREHEWWGEMSGSLCTGLGLLCAQLLGAAPPPPPAPALAALLARSLAADIDHYLWEDLVLESWWSLGGAQQFNFDITRNLMPVFSTYTSAPERYFPKLKEACTLLNLSTGTAMMLLENLTRPSSSVSEAEDTLAELGIKRASKKVVLKLLKQRTDLATSAPPNTPKYLLDLF